MFSEISKIEKKPHSDPDVYPEHFRRTAGLFERWQQILISSN